MNQVLANQFEVLEQQRADFMASLQKYTWEQLNQAPSGKWSANQVLAHLITSEKLSVQYMKKKVLGIQETTDTNWVQDVRMWVFKISQRLPLRYQAPKLVVERTPSYPALEALAMDWDLVRTELKGLLETIPGALIKRRIYKHPVAGRINVQQGMTFFAEHIIHHQHQLKRLLP
jgi:hypothetical protein